MKKTAAIILAAGTGTRMGGISKASLDVLGTPALLRTARAFDECKTVDFLILCVKEDEKEWAKSIAKSIKKPYNVISGGKTRQESASIALGSVPEGFDYVAVHDGARCLICAEDIDKVVLCAYENGAAAACTKVTDTVKFSSDGFVKATVDRENLYSVQTPQVFAKSEYERAMDSAMKSGRSYTDDCGLFEDGKLKIKLVETSKNNIKLTTPDDVMTAEAILSKKEGVGMIRVGHGYDAHRLTEGRPLILGGVNVPFEKGLYGHSDADVLVHAVMDAMLGAAALGDIGKYFPPSDDAYKGISSMILLEKVNDILKENGFAVSNIDATVVAQKPRLADYLRGMRENIAKTVGISPDTVSVKATTEEKMGFTGSLEGIAAHCVCLIEKR